MNFKNATNVSAADSVARGASIYMRLCAKLGDRREREGEAVASVRLSSRWGGKRSSKFCDFIAEFVFRVRREHTPHVATVSCIRVKYWTTSPDTNQRRELARITGSLLQRKSSCTFEGVNKRDGYFELTQDRARERSTSVWSVKIMEYRSRA